MRKELKMLKSLEYPQVKAEITDTVQHKRAAGI